MTGLIWDFAKSTGIPSLSVIGVILIVWIVDKRLSSFEITLKSITERIAELYNLHDSCAKDRIKEEKEIHSRITENGKSISRMEGRMNGVRSG